MPATINDIATEANNTLIELDTQAGVTSGLQTGGPGDAPIIAALAKIHAKRKAVADEAAKNILASADLDTALGILTQATKDLNTTAKVMTTVTGVMTNLAKYLGYGTDALNGLKSVTTLAAAVASATKPAGKG